MNDMTMSYEDLKQVASLFFLLKYIDQPKFVEICNSLDRKKEFIDNEYVHWHPVAPENR